VSKIKRLVKHSALRVLSLDSLQVDPLYQRDVKSGWKKIVEEFDEEALGIIVVGERSDGSLWIVDGQQRVFALRKMGKREVRAEVFRSEGVEHEAQVFKKINLYRVKLNPREQFKALLAAHDPTAWAVKETVESVPPFRISFSHSRSREIDAYNITAVNTLLNLYRTERVGAEGIRFALRAVYEAWKGDSQAIHSFILEALGTFWGAFEGTLDEEKMIDRLKTTTPSQLLVAAGQQAVGMDKRSAMQVILDRLYKRRRDTGRRKELRGGPGSDPRNVDTNDEE